MLRLLNQNTTHTSKLSIYLDEIWFLKYSEKRKKKLTPIADLTRVADLTTRIGPTARSGPCRSLSYNTDLPTIVNRLSKVYLYEIFLSQMEDSFFWTPWVVPSVSEVTSTLPYNIKYYPLRNLCPILWVVFVARVDQLFTILDIYSWFFQVWFF